MKRFIAILMTLIMVLGLSSVGVWADNEATWQTETPMPIAKAEMTAVTVGDNIYVIGGRVGVNYVNTVDIYNTKTKTWTTGDPMPTARGKLSSAVVGDKIYVIGGHGVGGAKTTIEIYDIKNKTWSTGTSLPEIKSQHVSAVVENKIYVIGGGTDSNTLYIYNIDTDKWDTGTPMPKGKSNATSAVIDGKIYVLGGADSNNSTTNTMYIYDPVSDVWTTGAPMIKHKLNSTSVGIGSKIYVMGGQNINYYNDVEIYDTTSNTWVIGTPLTTTRISLISAAINNIIYIMGGVVTGSAPINNVESLQVGPISTAPEDTTLTATGGNSVVDLSWGAASGADSYTVKRSLTAGGPYTVIAEGVTGTTYSDTDVVNGTTYYYVVTAVSAGGESANSNEASATPQALTSSGRALLVITLTNGLEKEYDLQMSEVNSFVSWYDGKAAGNGQGYYTFNKSFNLGPFMTRADYLTFDKIQNFEVMQYQ